MTGNEVLAERDAGVRGWINHMRYADTWGRCDHVFARIPYRGARRLDRLRRKRFFYSRS